MVNRLCICFAITLTVALCERYTGICADTWIVRKESQMQYHTHMHV